MPVNALDKIIFPDTPRKINSKMYFWCNCVICILTTGCNFKPRITQLLVRFRWKDASWATDVFFSTNFRIDWISQSGFCMMTYSCQWTFPITFPELCRNGLQKVYFRRGFLFGGNRCFVSMLRLTRVGDVVVRRNVQGSCPPTRKRNLSEKLTKNRERTISRMRKYTGNRIWKVRPRAVQMERSYHFILLTCTVYQTSGLPLQVRVHVSGPSFLPIHLKQSGAKPTPWPIRSLGFS